MRSPNQPAWSKASLVLCLALLVRTAAVPTSCGPNDAVNDCLAFLALARAWPAWGRDLSGTSVCGWPGAVCSGGRVFQLNINSGAGIQLLGSIPSEIGLLSDLEVIDLTGTGIQGSLPAAVGQLDRLTELYLGFNNISGPLPASLGSLSRLTHLMAPNNSISGVPSLPSLIQYLDLRANRLARVPAALGGLPDIVLLDLRGNPQLTGVLPDALCLRVRTADIRFDAERVTLPCALSPPPPPRGRRGRDDAASSRASVVREITIGFVVIICGCMVGCLVFALRSKMNKFRRTAPELGRASWAGRTADSTAYGRENVSLGGGLALDYELGTRPGPGRNRAGGARAATAAAVRTPRELIAACFRACVPDRAGAGADPARAGPPDALGGGAQGEPNPCVICLNAQSEYAVYPCGHLCFCRTCSAEMLARRGNCPVCRGPATDCIRIFFTAGA